MISRGGIVIERRVAAAADPQNEDLFTARAALKSALHARDDARAASASAQRAVDELRALVRRLEATR